MMPVRPARLAAAMSAALGQDVSYKPVTPEMFRGFGFPGADDLGNMFQFYDEFAGVVGGARSVEESRRLNPSLQDFRAWLERNKDRIPLE